jgi:alpha-L-rhamnosidase
MYFTCVLVLVGLAGSASALLVNDTQTWGATRIENLEGGGLEVGPQGNLTISGRVDMDSGAWLRMSGGILNTTNTFKFPDSSGDQNVRMYIDAGTFTAHDIEHRGYDRNGIIFVGGGILIVQTGYLSGSREYDPQQWLQDNTLQPDTGYDQIVFTDLGGGAVEITTATPNPEIAFESAASGALESISPALIGVILERPEEGQTYTVDYSVIGGTATAGVDYVISTGGPLCWDYATQCHGDCDNDANVKGSDFLTLKNSWYQCGPDANYNPCADFDRDGCVKGSDFLILKNNWYQTVEANCPASGGGNTLVFNPGETGKTIEIDIVEDGLDEEDETIIVELFNPTGPNVVLGQLAQHTYTIVDPRPYVEFERERSGSVEGAGSVIVSVILSQPASEAISVDYAVTGGSATAGADYTLPAGTLVFDPCETREEIITELLDDGIQEPPETVEITLSGVVGGKLGTLVQHTFTINDNDSLIVLDEFVGDSFSSFNHASTIAETHNGVLVVAWYGGSSEGADDVSIWACRNDGSGWSPRMEVDNGSGDATWNPALFQPSTGPLLLYFKYSGSPSSWRGAVRTSSDDGQSWSGRILLPTSSDPYLSAYGGRFVGPIKNRPIELPDGSLLCGSSTEHDGWQVHMEIARGDYTNDFELIGPLGGGEGIQSTFLVHDDGYQTIQALCRAPGGGSPTPTTWSYDGGQTWTNLSTISLETSKGLHAVTINNLNEMKNRWHIVAYNPSGRYPLRIATSEDGVNWNVAIDNVASGGGDMDYPTIMQTSDKMLHLVFSWSNHSKIRHMVLNPYVLLGESP